MTSRGTEQGAEKTVPISAPVSAPSTVSAVQVEQESWWTPLFYALVWILVVWIFWALVDMAWSRWNKTVWSTLDTVVNTAAPSDSKSLLPVPETYHKCHHCRSSFACYLEHVKTPSRSGLVKSASSNASNSGRSRIRNGQLEPALTTSTLTTSPLTAKNDASSSNAVTPQQLAKQTQDLMRRRRHDALHGQKSRMVKFKRKTTSGLFTGGFSIPEDEVANVNGESNRPAGLCCSSPIVDNLTTPAQTSWHRFCGYDCYAKHTKLGHGHRTVAQPPKSIDKNAVLGNEQRRRQQSRLLQSNFNAGPKKYRRIRKSYKRSEQLVETAQLVVNDSDVILLD